MGNLQNVFGRRLISFELSSRGFISCCFEKNGLKEESVEVGKQRRLQYSHHETAEIITTVSTMDMMKVVSFEDRS